MASLFWRPGLCCAVLSADPPCWHMAAHADGCPRRSGRRARSHSRCTMPRGAALVFAPSRRAAPAPGRQAAAAVGVPLSQAAGCCWAWKFRTVLLIINTNLPVLLDQQPNGLMCQPQAGAAARARTCSGKCTAAASRLHVKYELSQPRMLPVCDASIMPLPAVAWLWVVMEAGGPARAALKIRVDRMQQEMLPLFD